MSVLTQVGGFTLDQLWPLGGIPLGFALDLALGDRVFCRYPYRWLHRVSAAVEPAVRVTVAKLGGGRGGDLFGGCLLSFMVVGITWSVAFLLTDTADLIGGPFSLLVRAALIAAGLATRFTGNQILQAAGATDPGVARRALEAVGGCPPRRLDQLGICRVCVAAVGEKTSSSVIAPLFWVAVGGPAALWGFLAIRSLREATLARSGSKDLTLKVSVELADLAELPPAVGSYGLLALSAGIIRANQLRAFTLGWREGRTRPRLVPIWGQAALAGSLGVQLSGGRVFGADRDEPHPWIGDSTLIPDELSVVRAVRSMQISAILAAGLATLVTIFW